MTAPRPNVLLIVTDQQRADHLGCAGNALLRTPHIDQLAASGVRATRFHAASTTCMSNRATLMTGRLPSLHGVVHNGINLSREHTTFVELLRAAGYATALVGKSHLQSFGYDGPLRRQWINANGGEAPPAALQDARKRRRDGEGYGQEWTPDWRSGRRTAVATPYYGFDEDVVHFHRSCQGALAPFGSDKYPRFKQWCDDYFSLKHRAEQRGVGGVFFDDFSELGLAQSMAMTQAVGDAFLPAYLPIVQRRFDTPYGERERDFQLYRRGRYVEFNLVWDRGTHFGLQSGGRTESILLSMPPLASWAYRRTPAAGSPEAKLTEHFLVPRDWV